MRLLVTGGVGFIGREVVARLIGAGHGVRVVDRRTVDGGPEVDVLGDLRDADVRERAVTSDLDAIVHLAAETSVLGSKEHPALYHAVNVDVTAHLAELARQRGVSALVLASTNAVVGRLEGVMTEQAPLAPLTPYGATKAAAEMVLSGYSGAYGLRTPCLRLGNVYGAGMVEKDSLVPRLMRAAAAGPEGPGIEIYGDGRQTRDLVHVGDVAAAFVAAATDAWPSGPVIVGSGSSITVLDVIDAARAATGVDIAATHVDPQAGEMRAVALDTSLARSHGWAPTTPLTDAMASAWSDFAPAKS